MDVIKTGESNYRIGVLESRLCETTTKLAVMEATTAAKLEGLKEFTLEMKADLKQQFKEALALEAERRECGDKELFGYVNCNFAKNKKVIPAEDICPEVELKCDRKKAA
jgi:hypothetical protein